MNDYEQLKQEVKELRAIVNYMITIDKYQFKKNVEFRNPVLFQRDLTLSDLNLILSTVTGTKIGTSASQKIGVLGATPIIQQPAISAPSGGATVDSQARTAITSLINLVHNFGFTA